MIPLLDELLLFAHVIGATVLLGTGAGIAFFMLCAHRSKDPQLIAHVASTVVLADVLFTATAALFQPITGAALAYQLGYGLSDFWIVASIGLYVFVGLFWLPVVWIQLHLRNLAQAAAQAARPLPDRYHRLFRVWFACGIPAFTAMLGIFWLMLTKPV